MLADILIVTSTLAVILAGAMTFTNGIEWFGRKLNVTEGAVGSVFAAVGTALPETLIPLVAFALAWFRGSEDKAFEDIGVGAIVGAPLMLSTVAMCVTGLAIFIFSARGLRTQSVDADHRVIGRDVANFFLVYILAVGLSLVHWRWVDFAGAAVLLGLYAWYVYRTLSGAGRMVAELDLDALLFERLAYNKQSQSPAMWLVTAQVVAGLSCIVGGAYFFVHAVESLAFRLGVSPLVLAVIIAPIATELPEKFNSVIWVRQKKDTLALGNITGAMVFQSSLPPAVAMLFGYWVLDRQAQLAAGAAVLASIFHYIEIKIHKRVSPYNLAVVIVFYLAYVTYVLGFSGAR
jgi:cation:H+ antiporter